MYEAHKTKSGGGDSLPGTSAAMEDGESGKLDTSGEVPGSESESFFKSGNDVIMETDSNDEAVENQKGDKTDASRKGIRKNAESNAIMESTEALETSTESCRKSRNSGHAGINRDRKDSKNKGLSGILPRPSESKENSQ